MIAALSVLHVIVCIFLIAVVLLQRGKGAEMGAVFGGGASSTVFGSRGAGNFLTLLTKICAAVFMLTSLSLSYLYHGTSRRGFVRGRDRSQPGGTLRATGHGHAGGDGPGDPANGPGWTRPATTRLSRSPRVKTKRNRRKALNWSPSRRSVFSALLPRGSGGIGRRTSLRGWRGQPRGGSNPLCRTTKTGDCPGNPIRFRHQPTDAVWAPTSRRNPVSSFRTAGPWAADRPDTAMKGKPQCLN